MYPLPHTTQGQALRNKIKVGSSNKLCKECAMNSRSGNPEKPPLHPNCRCGVIAKRSK